MIPVYIDSTVPEKAAKEKYFFPENIMMENAASALEQEILNKSDFVPATILILSGPGNNGADGLALARKIQSKRNFTPLVFLFGEPKTTEAKTQHKMAAATGVKFITEEETFSVLEENSENLIIVDCLFGTGHHGQLPENLIKIIEKANKSKAYRIACDIPSGLLFNAHVTITMGALKSVLFTDTAKKVCGNIKVAGLGISPETFQQATDLQPEYMLIEKTDIKLPWRTDKSAHKGNFGHTTVFAGEKSGAGIIAGTAALNFGTGLVTLTETAKSNLSQFKISPELMISGSIPEKTSAILLGSGLGTPSDQDLQKFKDWFSIARNPACVLDADILTWNQIPALLDYINSFNNARIILTPHLKEFSILCNLCNLGNYSIDQLVNGIETPDKKHSMDAMALKLKLGQDFCRKYPHTVIIIKSANTLICTPAADSKTENYICADGTASLAKAGSGDVLAGMTAALLSQGYGAAEAGITAVEAHALAGASFSEGTGFDLTPLKLINALKN